MKQSGAVLFFSLVSAFAAATHATAAEPTTSGPTGFLQQTSLPAVGLPTKWSNESIRWQVELTGYGQSMPIAHQGRIYVSSVFGELKNECVVECFQSSSGKKLWQYRQPSSHQVESGPMVSRAAPTPVCDETAVYLFLKPATWLH